MASISAFVFDRSSWTLIFFVVLAGLTTYVLWGILYSIYLDSLAQYDGPRLAAFTKYWRLYIDIVQQKSFVHELEQLHQKYGDVVRIGPRELHFSTPTAHHDIYNNKNRWDKEETLYRSFGEDDSSFGFLTHSEAKERRDAMSRFFSVQSIEGSAQEIVRDKTKVLCAALKRQAEAGKPSDLHLAYRCTTMDVITYLCFGQSINAVDEPDFHSPLVQAMDNGIPIVTIFKHFPVVRILINSMPPDIGIAMSPDVAGLIRMQQLLKKQIASHIDDPETLSKLPHSTTIYHLLLNPDAYKSKTAASHKSLYDESQALMFGGGDTTANTVMMGTFYLLKNPSAMSRLKKELFDAWPTLEEEPGLKTLEALPYLVSFRLSFDEVLLTKMTQNAVIKESLRIGPNIPTGLRRVVPPTGAVIDGHDVPASTIVSTSSWFVHRNEQIFHNPKEFKPDRWLDSSAKDLEKWLVPFSRGTRMCLGFNLAWCELRMIFAYVFRKFDMKMVTPSPETESLVWREVFSPFFYEEHLTVKLEPVSA